MVGEPMEKFGSMPASIYIYVPDCDNIYEKAVKNGTESIMMPTDMDTQVKDTEE
jgi:PhnB protein